MLNWIQAPPIGSIPDSYVNFLSPVLPLGATMMLVTRANIGTAAAIMRKPKKYSYPGSENILKKKRIKSLN